MTDLAVELFKLWRAGAVALPTTAVVYSEAAQSIHATGMNDSGAFSGGQGSGTFGGSWANMRNLFQDQVLRVTSENLAETGEVLTVIATNYSQDDTATADALQKSIDGLPDSNLDQPPPYVPHPPKHDDPHPQPSGPGF